jgi:hypothetical protein
MRALVAHRSDLADAMLARINQLCAGCQFYYQHESAGARARGDSAVADSILARMPRPGAHQSP